MPTWNWIGPGQFMPSSDCGPFRRPPEDSAWPVWPSLIPPATVAGQAAPAVKPAATVDDLLARKVLGVW